MGPSRKNKFKVTKNRNNKVHLVFDEEKRREFLTGFRKRKLQRKKKAQEEFENQLKEEKKRLKTEAKESYKKLVQSYKPVQEVEHLLVDEYGEDNVTVKIFELGSNETNKQSDWIETENNDCETKEEIPGMELKSKTIKDRTNIAKQSNFESEKDLKKTLKKQATKKVKNSKIFQRKGFIEGQKQRKQIRKQKLIQNKQLKKKHDRNKHHKRKNTL